MPRTKKEDDPFSDISGPSKKERVSNMLFCAARLMLPPP
jgi:hypothetical protein